MPAARESSIQEDDPPPSSSRRVVAHAPHSPKHGTKIHYSTQRNTTVTMTVTSLPCVLHNNTEVVKQTNKQVEHPTFHIVYRNSTPGLPHGHQSWWSHGSTLRPTLIAEWGTASVARLAAPPGE